MPEHLRALIVIQGLALFTFWLLRPIAPTLGMLDQDFVRRRNLWLGMTFIAFLSGNFWIYTILTGTLLFCQVLGSRSERNPVALALFLAFAIPPFSSEIPFVAGVRYLISINHLKLVTLACMLPFLFRHWLDRNRHHVGMVTTDLWVLAHFLFPIILQLSSTPFTNILRTIVDRSIEILLPYFAASRIVQTEAKLRECLSAFTIACVLLAPIAIFEAIRSWLLYASLPGAMGVYWAMGSYLGRGSADSLRAVGSTGHAIALGYALCVGLFTFIALQRANTGKNLLRWLVIGLFAGGIIMAKSRGPWVGLAAGLIVYALLGRKPVRDLTRLVIATSISAAILFSTPYAERVIDLLPFIGNVDSENVTYRQRLLEIGWQIVVDYPFFGLPGFLSLMESMRQGQGIIDIVNSYLGIALSSGLIGLGLFVGAFGSASLKALSKLRAREYQINRDLASVTRGLLAAVACILVTIVTVSGITIIPFIYWCILGLLAGSAVIELPQNTISRLKRGSRAAPLAAGAGN